MERSQWGIDRQQSHNVAGVLAVVPHLQPEWTALKTWAWKLFFEDWALKTGPRRLGSWPLNQIHI